jgi:hypothetical protein
MSGRQTKDKSFPGRDSLGTDWFYPVDGGSVQVSGDATDGPEARDISLECKDGVCPVPWATTFPEVKTLPFLTTPSRPELQPDLVNHPPHYTDGSIECIDAIEAQLTPEEWRGYLKGSIAKYNWRERHKGGTESLRKARFYLDRLIMFDEN